MHWTFHELADGYSAMLLRGLPRHVRVTCGCVLRSVAVSLPVMAPSILIGLLTGDRLVRVVAQNLAQNRLSRMHRAAGCTKPRKIVG